MYIVIVLSELSVLDLFLYKETKLSVANALKSRVVKSFVTFFSVLVLVFIMIYLKAFGIDISGWLERWQDLSRFQSIFQLGAGVSLSFAVAGPKITDFISGVDREMKRVKETLMLRIKRENNVRYKERVALLEQVVSFIASYNIRNDKLNRNMMLYYVSYAIACILLLIISSFFDVKWQNKSLVIATFVSIIPPFFSFWHTNSDAKKINRMSYIIRDFAVSIPTDDPYYHSKGTKCLEILQQLYDILPPLKEEAFISYATDKST